MNIHPILVHFPIALLSLYSLITILPFQKWFKNISWKVSEQLLLITGVIGLFAAKASGEVAQKITQPGHKLIEMHELFVNVVTWFYVILIIIEFLPLTVAFIQKKIKTNSIKPLFKVIKKIHIILNKKWIIKLLSLLGIISLFITGLLGGVMVYGVNADPLAPFVLNILGLG